MGMIKNEIEKWIFLLVFLMGLGNVIAQNHVVLNRFNVEIYTKPSSESMVVCTAGKSTVFKLLDQKNGWVTIKLYSEKPRYVAEENVYFLKSLIPAHRMNLPENNDRLERIYEEIEKVSIQARKNADEIIPKSVDIDRHENYYQLRFDQLCQQVFEQFDMQPGLYSELVAKIKGQRWERGKSRPKS
jgi:hypothetical protein